VLHALSCGWPVEPKEHFVMVASPLTISSSGSVATDARLVVQRFVVRVGLKYNFPVSELVTAANALEKHGFRSRESLHHADERLLSSIVSPKLASALKKDFLTPAWVKAGRVPPATELEPESPRRGNGGRVRPVSYDDRGEKIVVSDMLEGFPTMLRAHSPSKRTRSTSRSGRSLSVGSTRQSVEVGARRERTPDNHELGSARTIGSLGSVGLVGVRSRYSGGAALPLARRSGLDLDGQNTPGSRGAWTPRSPASPVVASPEHRTQAVASPRSAWTPRVETPLAKATRKKLITDGVKSPAAAGHTSEDKTKPSLLPAVPCLPLCQGEGCDNPATEKLNGAHLCPLCLFKHATAILRAS